MPKPLKDAFRIQRYGPPVAGGWLNWPLRILIPAETALNVFETLTAVNNAMIRMEGDALARWQRQNAAVVRQALLIERIRSDVESDGR